MPRSGKAARERLRQATLELFERQGFDATTTAQIAAHAGLTERTFFRHFADKREALFDGEVEFRDSLTDAVLGAPQDLPPMAALLHAFQSVESILERSRSFYVPRKRIIVRTDSLQERALTKISRTTGALAKALCQRGIGEGAAAIAAQVGMTILATATSAWMSDPSLPFRTHLERTYTDVQHLLS